MNERENDMLCEFCDQEKPDVTEQIDPYRHEMWGEEVLILICDGCLVERVLSI